MKYLSKIALLFAIVSTTMLACTKENALPNYTTGSTPTLSSSKSVIAVAPADSNLVAVTFSWTNPGYATNEANNKYVLEIDSTGRNFAKSVKMTIIGALKKDLTGKELNTILLGFGFDFNVAYDIDVRLTSSYNNNNDLKVSNTIKVKATPYLIPPKITPPASGKLFIVGGATNGGWNNPVPVPTQEFAKLDATTFVGVFDLASGNEYLILPVNGDWSQKYAIPNNTLPGIADAGDFQYYTSGGDNFKSPGTTGKYLITMDFQRGRYTVVPFTGPNLPSNLFIVGDATPGGWNNPVPVPSQQFTRLNSCQFEIASLAITASKEYLLLPVNGDWSNKYSVANKNLAGLAAGGTFGYNLPDNFPGPTTAGNYKIEVNFATAKFKTTKL
ncbi:MAG: SusE domain-containing protein [Chitinophagaceae bacterium]|nr:SusE domain-containing protein [Chitinophagaceae bacterium]